jgi:hypothetical protein
MEKVTPIFILLFLLRFALFAQTENAGLNSVKNFSQQLTEMKTNLQNLNKKFAEKIAKDPYESSAAYEKKLFLRRIQVMEDVFSFHENLKAEIMVSVSLRYLNYEPDSSIAIGEIEHLPIPSISLETINGVQDYPLVSLPWGSNIQNAQGQSYFFLQTGLTFENKFFLRFRVPLSNEKARQMDILKHSGTVEIKFNIYGDPVVHRSELTTIPAHYDLYYLIKSDKFIQHDRMKSMWDAATSLLWMQITSVRWKINDEVLFEY